MIRKPSRCRAWSMTWTEKNPAYEYIPSNSTITCQSNTLRIFGMLRKMGWNEELHAQVNKWRKVGYVNMYDEEGCVMSWPLSSQFEFFSSLEPPCWVSWLFESPCRWECSIESSVRAISAKSSGDLCKNGQVSDKPRVSTWVDRYILTYQMADCMRLLSACCAHSIDPGSCFSQYM
jgi:hypothetical protein